MKRLLCLIGLLSALSATAQNFTYSTNLFYALPYTTNIFCGTNGADSARDSYIVIWNKINHNFQFHSDSIAGLNWALTNFMGTNGSALSGYVSKAGDSMTGPLVLSGGLLATNAVFNNMRATNFVVVAPNGISYVGSQSGDIQIGNYATGYTPFDFNGVTASYYGDGGGLTNLNALHISNLYSTNIIGASVLWSNFNNSIFPSGLAGNAGGWTNSGSSLYPQ
jgi:hypothetical protein